LLFPVLGLRVREALGEILRSQHAKLYREVCQEFGDGNFCIGTGKVLDRSCKCVSICFERAGEWQQDVSIFAAARSYWREIAAADQTRDQTRSHHDQAHVINPYAQVFPCPALRKQRERRGPRMVVMSARTKAWATKDLPFSPAATSLCTILCTTESANAGEGMSASLGVKATPADLAGFSG